MVHILPLSIFSILVFSFSTGGSGIFSSLQCARASKRWIWCKWIVANTRSSCTMYFSLLFYSFSSPILRLHRTPRGMELLEPTSKREFINSQEIPVKINVVLFFSENFKENRAQPFWILANSILKFIPFLFHCLSELSSLVTITFFTTVTFLHVHVQTQRDMCLTWGWLVFGMSVKGSKRAIVN